MKYIVKLFVITFFIILSTSVYAEQKIVVLDMKYILNNSKAGKGAQEFLKKSFNDNAKKFSEQENALKKEDYMKKSDSLRKKVIDYQSKRRASLDKIATQRAESKKKLLQEISPIVDTYIQENQISIVLDKKNMIGGLTQFDITDDIIKKLNSSFPSLNLK
jgi:Skp family chaperone for outer membrane proteins